MTHVLKTFWGLTMTDRRFIENELCQRDTPDATA